MSYSMARAAFVCCCLSLANAGFARLAQLPYVPIEEDGTHGAVSLLERSGVGASAWWAQVGDRLYHAPAEHMGLSRNVKDYYVTVGSTESMPEEMKAHYVGGQGRWNILHLPEGPSMLQVYSGRDRRSAFSSPSQLQNGMVLKAAFPKFALNSEYESGLNAAAKSEEQIAVAKVTPDAVKGTLQELVDLGTRSYQDSQAQEKAINFIQGKFRELKLATGVHHFQSDQSNVIACIPGSSSDSVTVGAHFDSRPYSGPAPGAEDNGSGVAVMLNIAKAFKEAKVTPAKTVYFVAFAAEEPGLIGSKAFATELKNGGNNLPAECKQSGSFLQSRRLDQQADKTAQHSAIVLDEVGWKSPNLQKKTVNLESYDWTDDVMQHMGHSSNEYNGDEVDVIHSNHPFGSDHMSFLDLDMKGVLAINGDDEKYPNYHQSTDTIDNVDPHLMSSIGKMCLASVMRLANVQT